MTKTEVKIPRKLKDSISSYSVSSQMLGMVKAGKTIKEIADHFELAWTTVKERLEVLQKESGEEFEIPEK